MNITQLHQIMSPSQAKLEERDKRYKSLLEKREAMKYDHSETLSDIYDQGLYYFKQDYFNGDEKKFKDFEEEYNKYTKEMKKYE